MKNKIPRFVQEYASYQKKTLFPVVSYNGLQNELERRVDRCVNLLERGLITVSECMDNIARPFSPNEDLTPFMDE